MILSTTTTSLQGEILHLTTVIDGHKGDDSRVEDMSRGDDIGHIHHLPWWELGR